MLTNDLAWLGEGWPVLSVGLLSPQTPFLIDPYPFRDPSGLDTSHLMPIGEMRPYVKVI